jgi:2-polyprenyl-3-methyl-5-hydroxy-6-metoxy-1,4-benzoquinol methylase
LVILGDASVERASIEGHGSPWFEACSTPTTVADLVRLAGELPALRRAYPSAKAVLLALLELDAAGVLRICPRVSGDALRSYYQSRQAGGDRSLSYVATYERNWQQHRDLYDFAEATDANAARKAFQRDIYLDHLGPWLDRLSPATKVLDAGCGVGRLTGALVERGLHVTCIDASAEALKCAVRVALHGGASVDSVDARLCDVRDLSDFDDGTFAATIALELICYQASPSVSLRELVRVTSPGGLVAVSVEGLYGSCIADTKLGAGERRSMLDTAAVDMDDQISVRYFTKDSLAALLSEAGLEAIEVVGTQYTADGVFDQAVTDEALADEDQQRSLTALEKTAAADPVLAPLARAWLAVARVPGAAR